MGLVASDLRFALRQLLKSPGFSLVAILTLALGIGANTAIFSVLDHLLVRPLPVSAPHQLVLLGQPMRNGTIEYEFNYPLFRDYQRHNEVFSQLSATASQTVGLGTGGATERQSALLVSGNYFTMLGIDAALGRTFSANEGVEIDDATVAILSHKLWENRFGSDPKVIGSSVTINAKPFTVIGVTPREFAGTTPGSAPDLYLPITAFGQITAFRPGNDHPLATRFYTWQQMMGRLKEGIPSAQAQASMQILAQRIFADTPANTATNLVLMPGARGFSEGVHTTQTPLLLLGATSALVLFIACANLANLQLARAFSRGREFAIRLALGAKRQRLIRQLLCESLMLALVGGLLGLLVAAWLGQSIGHAGSLQIGTEEATKMDARVLIFALLASTFTGVLFGLAPAWRATRPQLLPELSGGAATPGHIGGRWNLRAALVIFQIALSLMVLAAAGLCVRSLRRLQQVDPGFEPAKAVVASIDLGLNNYDEAKSQAFFRELLDRVRSLPGVESAALSKMTPLDGSSIGMSIDRIEGYEPPPGEGASARLNMISDHFFRASGIRLLAGRDFGAGDAAGAAKTVIVNESFARRFWPGQTALGKRLYQKMSRDQPEEAWEVVGVVASTAAQNLQAPRAPTMYRPWLQWPDKSLTLTMRTGINTSAAISALRATVKSLDANVPLFQVRTLEEQRDGSISLQRLAATALTGFGLLALLLASLGIYGVLAYAINQRTREIGIRMALGAQLRDVVTMVVAHGFRMALLGIALGLAGALSAARLLRSFLYEVHPLDPLTFGAVAALLISAALLACYIPARRAAKVDPMQALRHE